MTRPNQDGAPGEMQPGRLVLRTLGEAAVLVGGQRVEWPARSAEQLLWYLHAHPGGRYRHHILTDLWGQSDTPAAANRFRVALHRLRTALGRPDAVSEAQGRYVLHHDLLAASDTYALHYALDCVLHPSPQAPALDDRQRENLLHQALVNAQGDYLPHLQGEWVEQARAGHRAAVVQALLALAALRCAARECQLSTQALVHAAENDPLIGEDHHQRLMTCLALTRGRFAATEHYRRYRYFLAHEVGDTPMRETEQLAERIKRGEQTCLYHPTGLTANGEPAEEESDHAGGAPNGGAGAGPVMLS